MTGKIERTALLQYIFLYLTMQYFGGRIPAAIGNDRFFVLVLLIVSVTYLLHNRWIFTEGYRVNKFVFFEVIMIVWLVIELIYTSGGMTLGTITSFFLRFMVVHISIYSDPKNYLTRLVKMILAFAIISDLIYFSHFVGLTPMWKALSRFAFHVKSEFWAAGDTYGLFFIVFKITDLQRNSYMFGEPGEYQMIINTAIFFLLYYDKNIYIKNKSGALLVLLVTLLTIQSTTGFMSAIAMVILAFIQKRGNMERRTRNMLLVFVIIALIYCLFFATQDSVLYQSLINKLFSDEGKFDLFHGTATDRSMPFLSLMKVFQSSPGQVLFGVGPNGLSNTLMGGYTANGMINSIMMFGAIFTIIVYVYMINKNFLHSGNSLACIAAVFIVLNQAFSQPDMLSILTIVLLMWPYINTLAMREFGYEDDDCCN